MSLRRIACCAAALILPAGIACAFPAAAGADNPPPSQVLSNFENYYGANVVRDCGYSQPLPADPASSLWLFCDTDVYGFNAQGQWQLSDIISGSTAAEGPATAGQVPTDLSEVNSPGSGPPVLPNHDGPAQFLPAPSGLVTSGGQPCDSANGAYAASWLTGVTQDAAQSSDVLVSFNNYCVPVGGGNPLAEGSGLAEYDPASNTLDSQVTVFTSSGTQPLAPQDLLGSPVFSGGYLYLFASHCGDVAGRDLPGGQRERRIPGPGPREPRGLVQCRQLPVVRGPRGRGRRLPARPRRSFPGQRRWPSTSTTSPRWASTWC